MLMLLLLLLLPLLLLLSLLLLLVLPLLLLLVRALLSLVQPSVPPSSIRASRYIALLQVHTHMERLAMLRPSCSMHVCMLSVNH